MANNVSVSFSAQIGQLLDSVDKVKAAIGGLQDSADKVTGSFRTLAEIVGVSLSIEGIKAFIETMSELGAKTESLAQMFGVSTQQIGYFDAIAKGTGVSTETLVRGVETFALNLQKAQSGTGAAAEALKALGLSVKDFIGLAPDVQVAKFADAVSKFADGSNKLAAVRALWGRLGDDLIPLFDKGSKGFEEFTAMADRAGSVMSGTTAKAFDDTRLKITEFGLAMQGLGIRVFAELKPAVDSVVTSITKFIEGLNADKIDTAFKAIATTAVNALEQVALALVELTRQFDEFTAKLGAFDLKRAGLNLLDPNLGDLVLGPDKGLQKSLDETEKLAKDRTAKIKELAEQYRAAIEHFVAPTGAAVGGAVSTALPQVPNLPIPNPDALKAQLEQYQTLIKLADDAFKQTQEKLSSEVKLHQITYDQETQLLLGALAKRYAAENAAIDGELTVYARGSSQYQKALDDRKLIDQKYAQDRQKIIDQAYQNDAKQFEQVGSTILGAWNSQLRGLLAGTTSWATAFKNILGDLLIKFIEFVESMVVKWAAGQLAIATASQASKVATNLPMIQGDVGQAFAGFAAFYAPTLGPGAIGAATASAAAVQAQAVGLASADVGGYVLSDGLAVIHQGETITPASIAQPYNPEASGGAGSGPALTVNMSQFVGTTQFLQQIVPQLSRLLNNYSKFNPSLA